MSDPSMSDPVESRAGRACVGRQIMTTSACVLFSLAAGVACLSVSGCNTTEGVGEDIAAGGRAIDDAAEDAN